MPGTDLTKIKRDYLVLISIALIIISIFFAYKNIFGPLLNKWKRVSSEIEQRKKDIQMAKISPQDLEQLENEINEIKSQVDFYQERLKRGAEVPQILKEFNQIAESLKIKIVSVNPLPREEIPLPGNDGSLLLIPLKMQLKCGYHQFAIFINQLENSPRFMKIMNLQLQADSGNAWSHQAELVITSFALVSK